MSTSAAVIKLAKIQCVTRPYTVEIHNVACDIAKPNIIKLMECTVKRLNISRYSFNVWFQLHRTLKPNGEIWIRVPYRVPKSKRTVNFIDMKVKYCDIMSMVRALPVAREILNEVRRCSNFPLKCPIRGNYMHNITNMILTDTIVPIYAGFFDFNVTLDFYENTQLIGTYKVTGSIIPKSKKWLA
ncbi:uncharacterized protein LOC142239984 [Haematobia irritans]|uniref:uncharacterized protein LOC142239984 n=1 Tax=Haematobia irritans TaxID=7368 RepID=UPI003F4F693D